MSTLVVSRDSVTLNMRARNFGVYVDGNEIAALAHGAKVAVPIPAGRHHVSVGAWPIKSKAVEVNVPDGDTVHMRCWVPLVAWNPLKSLRLEVVGL